MYWWFKSPRYVGITNSPLYFLIGCPDYWKRLQTSQYAVFSSAKSWQHAEEFCRSMDAHLAKIESRDESLSVKSLLIDLNSRGVYWIGLSDIEVENDWKWSDGSSLGPYNPWASDSPGSPSADCVCIYRRPWHFRPCLNRQKFICEKKDWGRLKNIPSHSWTMWPRGLHRCLQVTTDYGLHFIRWESSVELVMQESLTFDTRPSVILTDHSR